MTKLEPIARRFLSPRMLKKISAGENLRILVVGSKPKFTHEDIGTFDLAFYANAAIARRHHFDAIESFNVLVESIFFENGSIATETAKDQIIRAGCENTIVLQSPNWVYSAWKSSTQLPGKIIDLSLAQKRHVVLDVLNTGWLLSAMIKLSPSPIVFANEIARLAFRGQGGISKPSTGIWAVLLACYICKLSGNPFNVVVSGIGLTNDGYSYSSHTGENMRLATHWIDPKATEKLMKLGVIFLDITT